MKKHLMLLVAALSFASCAPVAQLAQPGEAATLTRDGASLLLSNPGPDALTGDPGRAGDGPALTVEGSGLVPDDQAALWCKSNGMKTRLSCNLPNVPAGSRLRVTLMAGQVGDALLLAYRASKGAVPVFVALK
ncbi:hypothetical protein [Deinococcus budaensis]|uniref:IPT/TIG domain-containing protein n=1 Tax=Deinococcus budaensis TaxID=1665626 RepID=A0A7W8GF67_9DEIO|nr:hypothetical protein [Deinococcus budaensis]MBB5234492.1 hypothetical protein [Deinococcus budaensis]